MNVSPCSQAYGSDLTKKAPIIYNATIITAANALASVTCGRGLHSSSFQLNFSRLLGIRAACRGCLEDDQGVLGGSRGRLRAVFVFETAQVELMRGRA